MPPGDQVTFTFDANPAYSYTTNVGTGTLTVDPQALIGGPMSVGVHTLQVDFLGDGHWSTYKRIGLNSGDYQFHIFPDGSAAHWVRIIPDADCKATAHFTYN